MDQITRDRYFEQSPVFEDFGLIPVPKRLRYNPEKPFHFGTLMNISFGFASTFIVANLYYCQPILIDLADSFHVSYGEVSKSRIPTLIQAGYATGTLLISPLGDLVRRRQLILLLVIISTLFTIGLAVTTNFKVFEAFSYLVGVATVVPLILLPLAADLAPPERRASAISIVLSGLLLGILIARVLGGVIANFTSWRVIYYMSIGVQAFVLGGAYLIIPDYPAKNEGLTYFKIITSMAKLAVTEPKLIQAALINLASSACFTNFWVTLTFLLGGAPYYYSTLDIGLFGLLGALGVLVAPFIGKLIDRLVPWYAALAAIFFGLVFQAVQIGAGGINIAAVIIACFGLDVFRQMQQVSLTTSVYTLSTDARARLNAVLILSLFIGQVMGTSVGTQVFVKYGWRASAAVSMAWFGFQLFMLFLRGPHVKRYTWFGYEGGLEARKSVVTAREMAELKAAAGEDVREKSDVEKDQAV
ncbi:MFS superfamily [Athelia psychrophila]|uniref:MFS superfamily n=1 Tax=Athelia psychrophila TaxID=1759441 RepID=A0A165Y183_9AGAM|nr:MFS superfamily [Fibularhizoctonia sp. CBS 109695]